VRSVEGKAVGLEWVVIFLAEVSVRLSAQDYHMGGPRSSASCDCNATTEVLNTFVLGTADFAGKIRFATGVRLEQVAAVGAKDQGSDRRHGRLTCLCRYRACDFHSDITTMAASEGDSSAYERILAATLSVC